MTLSIIILNYKAEGLMRYCLKNIIQSNPNIGYEIIVVDNASPTGGVVKLKEEFKNSILNGIKMCGYIKIY